jgi:hypothetical protein
MVSMVIGCLEDEDTVGEFPTSLRKLPKTPFLRNDSAIAVAHFRQGTKGCDLSPTIHPKKTDPYFCITYSRGGVFVAMTCSGPKMITSPSRR